MGQAKLKGNLENRVADAIACKLKESLDLGEGVYKPEILFPGLPVADLGAIWLENLALQVRKQAWGELAAKPFLHVLMFILLKRYGGACHSTSASLFVLLSELGLSPSLCIGEVASSRGNFDHSWVEIDGMVIDAAVCLPLDGGVYVGGPVFWGRLRKRKIKHAKPLLTQMFDCSWHFHHGNCNCPTESHRLPWRLNS